MSDRTYTAIDLFCGAGGFSCGFEQAGISVKYGVDYNKDALETFDANHDGEAIHHDIREGIPDEVNSSDYDIVFGSPPCQGFSDARGSRHVTDDRNGLVFEYIHWVSEIQPKIAVMENVTGMLTISDDFMDGVAAEFEDSGYSKLTYQKMDSSDYGVPQSRNRVICVAVRDDVDAEASLPPKTHGEEVSDGDGSRTPKVTVSEALEDLPEPARKDSIDDDEPSREGRVELPSLHEYKDNEYSHVIRAGATSTANHVARYPSTDEKTQDIIDRLNPGEMYRSNRFGSRYRQVWDLLSDRFSPVEQDCFEFIASHRSKKDYRMKGKSVGPVSTEDISSGVEADEEAITSALEQLRESGWLRTYEDGGKIGYDLNSQSGIRPRYMRLQPDGQSNTILTTDFKPREKLHPSENRALSLREGARIQSFPDTFIFHGTFKEAAMQIGNAVPPLLSKAVGEHILKTLDDA